jgi:hypothetical protein
MYGDPSAEFVIADPQLCSTATHIGLFQMQVSPMLGQQKPAKERSASKSLFRRR